MAIEAQNTNVLSSRFYRSVGCEIEAIDLSYYTNHDVMNSQVAIFMKRKTGDGGWEQQTRLTVYRKTLSREQRMHDTGETWNIRWERTDERATARAVIRETWESAYAHIFSPDEIAGVFEGRIKISTDYGIDQADIGALVAEVDSDIVGVAALALLPDNAGEVMALYVKPACQGRGIGKALWDRAMEVFRERECVEAQVWVLAENSPAIAFYEHQGCVLMGEGEFRVGRHEERVLGYRVEL